MKLSENERKVMDVIWDEEYLDENKEITAKKASDILIDRYEWNKTSNYVYFNRLLKKGIITRRYPNYTIKALVGKEEIASEAVEEIINDTFSGSVPGFFRAFLNRTELDKKDLDEMKQIIDSYKSKK